MATKQMNFIDGPILKPLCIFTLPILGALILQTLYFTVDLMIVGLFSTVSATAGVSIGGQVITMVMMLCVNLPLGTTILIGHKIGEKNEQEIPTIISSSIALFTAVALLALFLIIAFIDPILTFMNTPPDAFNETKNYLFICALGLPISFAFNTFSAVFRGLGDSNTPLMAVAIAVCINIIADLLCVAVLNMGAGGAAMATVFAQTSSVLISSVIVKRKKLINYSFTKSDIQKAYMKKILSLGAPVALQAILVNISFLTIMVIVNNYGSVFSTAVGISEKMCGILMLLPMAFMQSLAVFVAQNYGAKNIIRAKKGFVVATSISFSYAIITAYLAYFHGDVLASFLNKNPDVIAQTHNYLKAYAFDTLLVPFLFCFIGFFNGCGQTLFVMVQGVVGALLLRVPFAYIFSLIEPFSLTTMGFSIPLGSFCQILACIIFYTKLQKKF